MAAKLPRKWIAGPLAQIKLRPVDKWVEYQHRSGFRPYFDTWVEAHAWLVEKANRDLAMAKRTHEAAVRHQQRVQAMQPPPDAEQGGGGR